LAAHVRFVAWAKANGLTEFVIIRCRKMSSLSGKRHTETVYRETGEMESGLDSPESSL
jgi:hypothetical protein